MPKPRLHPQLFQLLRFTLLARCVLDLAFAWRIHRVPDTAFVDLADVFAPFALLDGIIAFAVAVVAFAAWLPRAIVVLAATDAMLRLAAANALHFGPGISYFPMTIVLYIGLLAAFVLAFGIAEAVEALQIERQLGRNPLSIALAVASVMTVALAVAQFSMLHVPSALKNLLTIGIALQGLSMLAVAAGARRSVVEKPQ
jgi:hypothetical protein